MTKTMQIVTKRFAWIGSLLYAWGEGVDADEAAERVVTTFEMLCFETGWESVYWDRQTSIVYASAEDAKQIDPNDLHMLFDQALEQVVEDIANKE